jgi:hypothetical protein
MAQMTLRLLQSTLKFRTSPKVRIADGNLYPVALEV